MKSKLTPETVHTTSELTARIQREIRKQSDEVITHLYWMLYVNPQGLFEAEVYSEYHNRVLDKKQGAYE